MTFPRAWVLARDRQGTTMKNAIGREIPLAIPEHGNLIPFAGAAQKQAFVTRAPRRTRSFAQGNSKMLPSLEAAVEACALRNGATLSFHHHLRNGDAVLNEVVAAAARVGLRDLRIAATSIFPVHAPLVE